MDERDEQREQAYDKQAKVGDPSRPGRGGLGQVGTGRDPVGEAAYRDMGRMTSAYAAMPSPMKALVHEHLSISGPVTESMRSQLAQRHFDSNVEAQTAAQLLSMLTPEIEQTIRVIEGLIAVGMIDPQAWLKMAANAREVRDRRERSLR